MNRVLASFASYQKRIDERLASGQLTSEKLVAVGKSSDIGLEEFISFNEVKSLAHAMGMISYEEAQTIYEYLGESGPERFNAAPIHVKVALTQILAELTSWKLRGAPAPTQRVA